MSLFLFPLFFSFLSLSIPSFFVAEEGGPGPPAPLIRAWNMHLKVKGYTVRVCYAIIEHLSYDDFVHVYKL